MINISLNSTGLNVNNFKSKSQKIRILTEWWVNKFIFCPNCGGELSKFKNNTPFADFFCNCGEEFELKSLSKTMKTRIVDGAYSTAKERILCNGFPNIFILNYDVSTIRVKNFLMIPGHFFSLNLIEERKPLTNTAKRAGWVGCNLLLGKIPVYGKLFYIENYNVVNKEIVLEKWEKMKFLKKINDLNKKGWILEILKCLDGLDAIFTLKQLYSKEEYLKKIFPNNRNIKAKIRQQLQILRDYGLIQFLGNGLYNKI